MAASDTGTTTDQARPTLAGHLAICRFDHWFKNVFVFPGIVVALALEPQQDWISLALRTVVALLAIGFVASSNYVVNELRDAPFDRFHPLKRRRPVPSGQVHVPLAYAQWIALAVLGIAIGLWISQAFAITMVTLWLMGCLYNLQPLRTKDLPYLDVLSEAVNNPLRMLAGFFIVAPDAIAPASLLLSYWMIGCYFMALKRFAEWREIGDPETAARYRRSFAHYDEPRLLVSVMFYGSASMLFLGAFIMRYKLTLILSFPAVALVMALYLKLALAENSPVQNPEQLYKEGQFMAVLIGCALLMVFCLFWDSSLLAQIFTPTAPTNPVYR